MYKYSLTVIDLLTIIVYAYIILLNCLNIGLGQIPTGLNVFEHNSITIYRSIESRPIT